MKKVRNILIISSILSLVWVAIGQTSTYTGNPKLPLWIFVSVLFLLIALSKIAPPEKN